MELIRRFFRGETMIMAIDVLVFLIALAGVVALYLLIIRLLGRQTRKTRRKADDFMVDVLKMPLLLLLVWAMLRIFSQSKFYDTAYFGKLNHGLTLLLIITIGWILIKVTRIMFYHVEQKLNADTKSSGRSKSSLTKLTIFERMIVAMIVVVTVAVCLMTFKSIRTVGVGLLSSAGLAGIVIGFAAQKSLSSIMAGIQIAIAQPIKLDDLIVIDNQTGRVEEIKMTYVVVRMWDQRRMIVPINYFVDNPIENWSRNSTSVSGSVILYLDYDIPMDALRAHATRLVESDPDWDRLIFSVEVVDMLQTGLKIRVLLSSADSARNWSLCVRMREALITFVRTEYPDSFILSRTANLPDLHAK